jgi:hypothetical protein
MVFSSGSCFVRRSRSAWGEQVRGMIFYIDPEISH